MFACRQARTGVYHILPGSTDSTLSGSSVSDEEYICSTTACSTSCNIALHFLLSTEVVRNHPLSLISQTWMRRASRDDRLCFSSASFRHTPRAYLFGGAPMLGIRPLQSCTVKVALQKNMVSWDRGWGGRHLDSAKTK